jgi:hypothetical protein
MVLFKLFDKLDFDFFPKSNNPTPTSSIKQILEESKLEEVKQDWIDSPDEVKFRALGFLIERDLLGGFRQYYLATDGPLKNRLVIPYISDNKIYYFQARRLFDYHNPKYLTPSSDCGIDKRSILYPFRSDVSFLVVTEGPVDAITLQCDELNATCIMGSHITKEQMDLLKQFKGKLIVGFNNDDPRKYPGKTPPGLQGLHYFSKVARQKCLSEFYYCFPPNPYKDWNDMWVAGESCNDYIFKNYKKFDTFEWKMKLTNNGSVNFTTSGIIQGTII